MKKSNIPPFVVGDKVVYITGISMPKGSTHIVNSLFQSVCGCWSIGINNVNPEVLFVGKCRCSNCKSVIIDSCFHHKTCWRATSFRKVSEQKVKLISFETIKENEKEEILTLN
jgi:hypothetical protein